MNGSLEVIEKGLFTSIQDVGRPGFKKYGIPVSGALDSHAYILSNWLVSNKNNAPVLELTLAGGRFRFNTDSVISITGAPMQAEVNGKAVSLYQTVYIKKGDVLKFGFAKSGCRSYVAIHGLWNVEKVMGSYSACLPAGFGGLTGKALAKGDILEWEQGLSKPERRTIPDALIPDYSAEIKLHILTGPEWDRFEKRDQQKFLSSAYEVSSQSNRMGIKLISAGTLKSEQTEMVSSAVIPGIIQLPKHGSPIILMNDCQSVGGYPRIAKVIDADLWKAAQLAPGMRVHFEKVNIEEAMQYQQEQKELYKPFK